MEAPQAGPWEDPSAGPPEPFASVGLPVGKALRVLGPDDRARGYLEGCGQAVLAQAQPR